MAEAFINRIATAVPPYDVHQTFLNFGQLMFGGDNRRAALFDRMAGRSGIEHRYSHLAPAMDAEDSGVNAHDFYRLGQFPNTAARMRLFERFAQLDSTDVRRIGGTGLGLSICRGIIERLVGRIDHVDREGGGSTFYFELPVVERQ